MIILCAHVSAGAQADWEASPLKAQESFHSPAAFSVASSVRVSPTPANARSSQTIPHFHQKLFPAPANGACGLKSFTLIDYEARSKDSEFDQARLSLMGAVYETTSPDCIRDYGIVQFIRGCAYSVRYAADTGAELERTFDIARWLRGKRVVFNHPDYEADTNAEDPLYSAAPEQTDRLALSFVPDIRLRLRSDNASMLSDLRAFDEHEHQSLLLDHPEPVSMLYITDLPDGGVSMIGEDRTTITVTNTSLDFRTCLYRIKDVPTSGSPAGEGTPPENGGPIQCFSWASRYTYDITTKDFVTDRFQGVDPFCAQAPKRVPLPGS